MNAVIPRFALLAILLVLAACDSSSDFRLVGTLERDRIVLPAERSEPVVETFVEQGARLQTGDLILQLDPRRVAAELEQRLARLQQAQRRVDELVRGPRTEHINEARARLAAIDAQLENARAEFARIRKLTDENLASAAERDAALAARDRVAAERKAARAALETLLEGTTVEELDQARAQVQAAAAAVKEQEVLLQRLTVKAPRAARLEALPYETGSQPPAGAAVAVLLAEGAPFARVHIPVAWRERFSEGSPVTVEVPGFGAFKGTVRWVSSDAAFTPYYALTEHDRGRLSHAAEIRLPDSAHELPAGIPVEVRPAATP